MGDVRASSVSSISADVSSPTRRSEKENDLEEPFHLDSVLEQVGEFGKYQFCLLVLTGFISAYGFSVALAFTFVGYAQKSRCFVAGCDDYNGTAGFDNPFVSWAIPHGGEDGCWQFTRQTVEEYDHHSSSSSSSLSCNPQDFTNETMSCHGHFVFDRSVREDSITAEYGLVCGEKRWVTVAWSAYMVGRLVGSLGWGLVSDRYGRRRSVLPALFVVMTPGLVSPAFRSLPGFMAVRILTGIGEAGVFQTIFVLLLELSGPKWRTFLSQIVQAFFALGGIWVGLAAYWIRSWVPLQLTLHGIGILLILACWFLPESPRFLISKGRVEEANALMRRIAAVNGRKIPDPSILPDPQKYLQRSQGQKEKKGTFSPSSILQVFRSGPCAMQFIIICYCWFVNVIVFYGLTISSTDVSPDPYLGFILSNVVEWPADVVTLFLLQKVGRRVPFAGLFLVGGAACLAAAFSTTGAGTARMLLTLIGKLCITGSFNTAYMFTAELYPTAIRNSSVGTASMCARVGGILAPFIMDLNGLSGSLPLVIMGSLTVLSGLLALNLPETKDVHLPETMDESETLTRTSGAFRLVSSVSHLMKGTNNKSDTGGEFLFDDVHPEGDNGPHRFTTLNMEAARVK